MLDRLFLKNGEKTIKAKWSHDFSLLLIIWEPMNSYRFKEIKKGESPPLKVDIKHSNDTPGERVYILHFLNFRQSSPSSQASLLGKFLMIIS